MVLIKYGLSEKKYVYLFVGFIFKNRIKSWDFILFFLIFFCISIIWNDVSLKFINEMRLIELMKEEKYLKDFFLII